ncbi:MAG: glycosyltransferase family 4 protein [Nitrospiraceae bacterium]
MQPHRIIHVITRLDHGGSALNTMSTAIGQDRTKYEPIVVAGVPGRWDAQGGMAATEENCRRLDKEQIRWQLIPTLTREVNPSKDLRTLWSLIQVFRRERPSIVHTHTSKAGALGRVAAWMTRVPAVIHTPHGHVFYGHFGPVTTRIFLLMEQVLAKVTTWMIGLTEAERSDHLERRVGRSERFAVAYSGIDLDRFRQVRDRRGERPSYFRCPSDAVIVGSVGWLTPIKGHRFLIQAVAQLKPVFPKLHLVIVGSGDLLDELSALAKELRMTDSVQFLGERTDVDACLAGMDCFVLSSLNEGMGRALIEAMAAGLPVIATHVGGIPALIEQERTGLLVPPGDAQALGDALRRYLDHPEWAREVGIAASQAIGPRFGVGAMVQVIEGLYDEALKGKAVRP